MNVQDALLWVVAGGIVVLLVAVMVRLTDLKGRLDSLPKADGDLLQLLQRLDADSEDLSRWSNNAEERLRRIEDALPTTLAHSSIVRYDAFPDLFGHLSRSIAVIDGSGSGFVLTVLVNRDESRFFLKGITDGQGDEPLSPEEMSAVEEARRL